MLDFKNNIISPIIVSISLGVMYWAYDKVNEKTNEYQKLVETHPEILQDLQELKEVKGELTNEYKVFKAKTNVRLKDLEAKQDGVFVKEFPQLMSEIRRVSKRDSLYKDKVEGELNYLRSLH